VAIILNIETSGLICSVSIANNETVLSENVGSTENDHASLLTNLISSALVQASKKINELEAIAVSSGPGSYTGLRIGTSTAKGICHALQIPFISIPTLRAMVLGASLITGSNYLFCPLIDARRFEVFTAIYTATGEEIFEPQPLILAENIFHDFLKHQPVLFFGSGLMKSIPFINHPNSVFLKDYQHKASCFASLAYKKFALKKFESLAYFEPQYLKTVYTTKGDSL
jgi:tRNA threonylcarbamoyladenosine biosynthesis protein TsaB